MTVSDNYVDAAGSATGYVGAQLDGDSLDDIHVLRNEFTGMIRVGVNMKQAIQTGLENGTTEIRQNTITNVNNSDSTTWGIGVRFASNGSRGRVEIEHNRIVNNSRAGLIDDDPDAVVDARHNWWGCNAGPNGGDPGCGDVTGPDPATDPPPYAPWMTLTLTATPTPTPQYAGNRSTLLGSVNNLSNGLSPTGPFFLTGRATFASTPPGTHVPGTLPLTHQTGSPDDITARSQYEASDGDPDELRVTVDNQTVRIRISRPPKPIIVPVITPDDPTLTPGERVDLLVRLINEGNAPARRIRACVRLSDKLDPQTGLCQRLRKLDPGDDRTRRISVRVKTNACGGRLQHQLTVRSRGQRPLIRRAIGRLLAGPCRTPPCPAAARASRSPVVPTGAAWLRGEQLPNSLARAKVSC